MGAEKTSVWIRVMRKAWSIVGGDKGDEATVGIRATRQDYIAYMHR